MIYFNGNTYKTLDQKFYLGNKQIGYVYKGETLIYPEKKIENKIEIDGINIDVSPYYVNGNMYDLGIQATANTRFELCIKCNSNTSNNSRLIFGAHHDNYNWNVYYRTRDGKKDTDGGTCNVSTGNAYPNNTSFHLIMAGDSTGVLRFRYGGQQKNYSTSDQNDNSGGDYNLAQKISTINNTENKAYTICLEKDGVISSAFDYGKYYYEQQYNAGNITEEEYNTYISQFKTVGNITKGVTNNSNPPTFSGTSAHLWLNAINRYVTDPNKNRCYTEKQTSSESLTYYYPTTNFAFIYLIIYKYSSTENSVSDKMIFTQRLTNELDNNNNKIVVFDQHLWDFQNKKFKKEVNKTIYPFSYCEPVI